MNKHLKIICEVVLVGSSVFLSASPAISSEIDWVEVPGTREPDSGSGDFYSLFIGENTITREGDAINFDIFFDRTFHYTRAAGNCRTGYLAIIASGYYTGEAQLVIDNQTQRPFDPDYNAPRLALEFACSQ